MYKKLVINADDFGWDSNANSAILDLASKKAITSTTVMANMVYPNLLENLKSSGIGIGLHLNLIEGEPISQQIDVSSLVDKYGEFKNWQHLLKGFVSGKVEKVQLENEIIAQIDLLRTNGIEITHVDSHKHIHQLPFLGPFILNTLKRNGISRVRYCSPTSTSNLKMASLKVFSTITSKHLSGFRFPDILFSFFSTHTDGDYSKLILNLKSKFDKYNCIELMTHPGVENRPDSYLNRKAEYHFLLAFSQVVAIELPDVQLVSYNYL